MQLIFWVRMWCSCSVQDRRDLRLEVTRREHSNAKGGPMMSWIAPYAHSVTARHSSAGKESPLHENAKTVVGRRQQGAHSLDSLICKCCIGRKNDWKMESNTQKPWMFSMQKHLRWQLLETQCGTYASADTPRSSLPKLCKTRTHARQVRGAPVRRMLRHLRMPPVWETRDAERKKTKTFQTIMQELQKETTMHRKDRERKTPL